ncbi:MAG TPA: hypothetical protein DCZ95_13715 [Verrucomicrobia bacterium]|nr:MAG: hypothetical protein A2X46_02155 [Lentisphaerae bacterium GWF2_57_35]HBA85142.1 hypothetical protein [Verrucomicrobiota bacterium]
MANRSLGIAVVFLFCAVLQVCASVYTVTNPGDAPTGGTLRWAIRSVETNPGPDEIRFNLSAPYTIQPTGALPIIVSDNVTISGDSQPGYTINPLVKLSGAGVSSGSGLSLVSSSGSVVRALHIFDWPSYGAALWSDSRNVSIVGCWIISNGSSGVYLSPANYCTVGGEAALSKNVISGNSDNGIFDTGLSNLVLNSYIGCDPSGLSAMPNGTFGIFAAGQGTTIGSTSSWARNVISGNNGAGICLRPSATNVTIVGNYIGTDFAGVGTVSNYGGILIEGSGNLVGGGGAGTTNVIAGNRLDGIRLSGASATGNRIEGNLIGINVDGQALPNTAHGVYIFNGAHNNFVGGTSDSKRNIISGNKTHGVSIYHANDVLTSGNVVRRNFIGTDITGSNRVPNENSGVYVRGSYAVIGGNLSSEGNLISGNGNHGIWLDGTNAANCRIQNNLIGLNASGSAGVSNASHGIYVSDAPDALIGGTNDGNIVSGNGGSGISIGGPNSDRATIMANVIGTDGVTVTSAIPNGVRGIDIAESDGHSIGGALMSAANLISGNNDSGIVLNDTANNQILNNVIGVNGFATGPLGNGGSGILLGISAAQNTIQGNIIGCNGADGIAITYASSIENVIRGNWIGRNAVGPELLGNGGRGIRISDAPSNTIGGFAAGEANFIANNSQQGVAVIGSTAVGNRILGNGFMNNGCLGISLRPTEGLDCVITTNDPGDPDLGPNRLQNFPILAAATNGGATLNVRGALNSTANSTFWVHLYGSSECMAHGYGEGEMYLGVVTVRTDVVGNGGFTNAVPIAPPSIPSFLTVLATDTNRGDTSEFSLCMLLDRDRDGMPDDWENEYFGSPTGGDPSGHLDADGVPNLGEFVADTDPSNPASYLSVSIARTNAEMELHVPSSAHRQYDFEVNDNWCDDPNSTAPWGVISANVRGDGKMISVADNSVTNASIYRVRVHLP